MHKANTRMISISLFILVTIALKMHKSNSFGLCREPVDSHLHVWSDGKPPFPFQKQEPPADILNSQAELLTEHQKMSNVGGALIVQPINHEFDHSYLKSVISSEQFKGRYKGMCLLDPTQSEQDGLDFLSDMKAAGMVGVRFNPYLWPENEKMGDAKGQSFYKKAGELGMPVGFMCFKGLPLHYEDIISLLEASPDTKAIIDHWGFFLQNNAVDENSWTLLLSLARYPQVYIKLSALFRVSKFEWPYQDLDRRLVELANEFGAQRLMWGTDYPFVMQQCGYSKALSAFKEWKDSQSAISAEGWDLIFRGTAESLFGSW